MYKNIKRKLLIIPALFLYLLPTSFLLAKENTIDNPIGASSITALLSDILAIVVRVGTPVVVLAIIYAGFKFVAARGNSEKIDEAKRTLLYVVIGAAIILGAEILKEVIEGTVASIKP